MTRTTLRSLRWPTALVMSAMTCVPAATASSAQDGAPAAPVTFAERHFAEAERLLRVGDREAARAALERVLERDDRHLSTLALLGRMAEEDGDPDLGLWRYYRYLEGIGRRVRLRGDPKQERDAVLLRVEVLDPQDRAMDRAVAGHVKGLRSLARSYDHRSFHASALRTWMELLALKPDDAEARRNVDRIRAEGGADVAVEDVRGGADPLADVDPEWIAEQDALHADWDSAWRKKTDNYTIVTNAGYEVLETAALVMEQMNRFYREVFRHAEDGTPTPRIEVWIFRDQAQFKARGEPPSDWAAGYYDGTKVVVYDSAGQGGSRRDLWVTLFHEAGHQFVDLAGGPVAKWANEGIASYFEGSRILSNREVVHNLVPEDRLLPLHTSLFSRGGDQRKSLSHLITRGYGADNEYGPDHYPYGWGLTYFLLNQEDDAGRKVYRDLFDAYFKSFRRPAREALDDDPTLLPEFERLQQRTPVQRFQEFFVERAAVPGIDSLADLEAAWHQFIDDLYKLHVGDRAYAQERVHRAQERAGAGHVEGAIALLEPVVERHPRWAAALWDLGRWHADREHIDRALCLLEDFLALTDGQDSWSAARDEATTLRKAIDPLKGRRRARDAAFDRDVSEIADAYLEAGLPRMAMHCLDALRAVRGLAPSALRRLERMEADTGRSIRRWRLLFNESDLDGWSGATQNYWAEDGLLHCRVRKQDRPADIGAGEFEYRLLFVDREVEGDFTFEAEALSRMDDESGRHCRLLGLAFAARNAEDFRAVNFLPFGTLDFGLFRGAWETDRQLIDGIKPGQWVRLRIEVKGDQVSAFLDGQRCFEQVLPSGAVEGDFGVLAGDGHAVFRNLRLFARW